MAGRRSLRHWAPLAAVLVPLAAVLLLNLGAFEMLIWDEAEYASLGRSLARGEGYRIGAEVNVLRPPALPLSVAASLLVFGDGSELAAKIPTIVFTLLLVAAVYVFVLAACGPVAAVAAAVAVAVSPELVVRGVMVLSETPFTLFHIVAVLTFARGFERDTRWFYASWLAFALALSTRYTALLFGPTLVLVVLWETAKDRTNALCAMRSRPFLLAPLLCAAPILLPWYVRQWLVAGDPLIAIRYASSQIPSYSTETMPWHFYLSALPDALTWPVLVGATAGFVVSAATGRRIGIYSAAAAFVLIAWHTQYGYKEVRLITPALPFFAVAAGTAVQSWLAMGRRAGLRWCWAVPAAGLAAAAFSGYGDIVSALRWRIALGEPAFLHAAHYIRTATSVQTVIAAAAAPQAAWHADRYVERIPPTLEEFRKTLKDVDWVILTNFERSEPDYLSRLPEKAGWSDQFSEEIRMFGSGRFRTMLAHRDWVRRNLPPAER